MVAAQYGQLKKMTPKEIFGLGHDPKYFLTGVEHLCNDVLLAHWTTGDKALEVGRLKETTLPHWFILPNFLRS